MIKVNYVPRFLPLNPLKGTSPGTRFPLGNLRERRENVKFKQFLNYSKNIISIGYIALYSACVDNKGELVKDIPYCDTGSVSFSRNIVPVLKLHCSNPPFPSCHTWVTNYSQLIPNIESGKVQNRVLAHKNMPPPNNIDHVPPLSDSELRTLECWIYQGAYNN